MSNFIDEVEALDPSLVPALRTFPIERYAEILRSGKAAASPARYNNREDALRDIHGVVVLLRYYRDWHPDLAPEDFGQRTWQSKEDGRWRWAILPEHRQARPRQIRSTPPLGRPR